MSACRPPTYSSTYTCTRNVRVSLIHKHLVSRATARRASEPLAFRAARRAPGRARLVRVRRREGATREVDYGARERYVGMSSAQLLQRGELRLFIIKVFEHLIDLTN
jgi:hypothetical protein